VTPLTSHLRTQLGAWPPDGPFTVATSPARTEPGWDGVVRPVVGLVTPEGGVLSVAPELVDTVTPMDLDVARTRGAVYRWSDAPGPTDDPGTWVPHDDARLPDWLRPFGGEVLVVWDDEGRYAAGVGLKRHDDFGWEISVGTEEAHRGKGLARRLTAQAARTILDAGRVPLYLHAQDNHASAKAAEAAGFPDRGWRYVERHA
jgi:RimJ/RimL family protein N-acetyltransferase